MKYLAENYPTREQMIQVRECVTARTGYEFGELSADFGPELLTKPRPADIEETPDEVMAVYTDCIFKLGLEDRFFPPWVHERLLADDDS